MYKSQLQELCHKQHWTLPRYATLQEGLGSNHPPRYKATVFVKQTSFHSPSACTSSKKAQNEAAKSLLSLQFRLSGNKFCLRDPKIEEVQDAKLSVEGPNIEHHEGWDTYLLPSDVKDDGKYKSLLQNYAQWKSLGLPLYTCINEGPPRNPLFKARVSIGGCTYESSEFFRIAKEAEHSAAKAALMSLSLGSQNEEKYLSYKNLLQELCQREEFSIPIYRTTKTGPSHIPVFYSTVEIEGEFFHGKGGKTKKEAETKAAKFAYSALKGSTQVILLHRLGDLHKTNKEAYLEELPSGVMSSAYRVTGVLEPSWSKLAPTESAEEMVFQSRHNTMANANVLHNKTIDSYLLCNRFIVSTRYPEIQFPEDVTVLPISDGKWVAVSSEYPKELGNRV